MPPAGYESEQLQSNWQSLVEAEAIRKRGLTKYIRDAKEALGKQFASEANHVQEQLNNISSGLGSLSGDLQGQLSTTQSLLQQAQSIDLSQLQQLNQDCLDALIEDNEFTIYSLEDLQFDLSLVIQSVTKKISFIENQIVARTKTNFTPAQLEEYSETFRLFDKDQSNTLIRDEFKAALAAEGTALKDEEFESVFLQVSQGKDEITFEQFIEYARTLEEDKVTPEQLLTAFQTLASEKKVVTEADLYRGGLDQATVEYLKQHLPAKDDGYDFQTFVGELFI